ncbi:ADP-ribosylation factor GTPase-activating protein 2 [Hypsibius exemplaris]|uniref:ADP-ribosylation factor GTPase-activating protein 2 n=1 Tax=Hypsibius exemplaris TaxID=2072580 RepID=A0A1W0WTH8_HYPEX|nr:ADP-ribosylation factor GTPase-activating protein 2 [Hypsibius exemplaris]
MSDDGPSKVDVAAALKRLRGFSSNKTCFDCGAKNPTWASVTYGVFLCIDCSAVHRSLGVHLTFIRSTQLDTNWTWLQLRAMQLGGNAHAADFFRQHGSTTTDAQQKYNSRAAQLYKEKLQQMAIQSMKVHGSKLHLDTAASEEHAEEKRAQEKKNENVDFFAAHSENAPSSVWQQDRSDQAAADKKSRNGNSKYNDDGEGPSVDSNLDEVTSADSVGAVGKHTLASRKVTGKAAKKGKLGAQRVETNFDDMEKEADEMEKRRQESLASSAKFTVSSSAADDDRTKLSTRLAYQDVEVDRKKEEDRIRKVDPKKAEQLERLGMGIGARGKISHSILSDMTTIEQGRAGNGRGAESSSSNSRSYGAVDRQPAGDDEWDRLEDQPPKGYSSRYESKSAYSRDEPKWGIEDKMGRMNVNDRSPSGGSLSSYQDDYRPAGTAKTESSSRQVKKVESTSAAGDDAQKKFGNAKSISSDMYFGNSSGSGSDWETKSSSANRFEGKSSISSADYFGTGSGSNGSSSASRSSNYNYSNMQTPDLEDIKEGVKQGITKVAGRLSSMANSVMTNIQDRYG